MGRRAQRPPLPREPRATLVTDFYSYNTNMVAASSNLLDDVPDESQIEGAWMQPHWVGDLTLQADLDVQKARRGRFGPARARQGGNRSPLHDRPGDRNGSRDSRRRRAGPLGDADQGHGPPSHRLRQRRRPRELDRRRHAQQAATASNTNRRESIPIPTEADLAPAAIAARNAEVVASDLVLKRDIYYTQYPGRLDYGLVWDQNYPRSPAELFDFLSDPSRFPSLANVRSSEYEIGPDRFFMMGDNSPRSKDSRGWASDDSAWDSSGSQVLGSSPAASDRQGVFTFTGRMACRSGPTFRLNHPDIRIIFPALLERMKWIR